jgi:serine/threonine protein kinase
MQTKNSQFLAKGTYGCVFYPSINACSGKIETDIDSDHYITKIQMYLPNEDDEIIIGQKLQKLPLYDNYFAPVIKSCKINAVQMDYKLVKSCAIMQNELGELNKTTAYISNKIRYVGKYHIAEYLRTIKSNHQKLYRKLVNTHLHLLDALQLLVSENIVHFDIKPQNVMYDEIQDVPVIIDFGLSRSITPLLSPNFSPIRNEKLMRHTFVSYDTYDYWCIDIYILSNIGSNTYLKPYQIVTVGQIKALLRGFISPNFLAVLSGEEVSQFKQRVFDYFSPFVKHRQTWMNVFRVLIQNYAKWDNYSAAMTYLYGYLKAKPQSSSTMREPVEMYNYFFILKNIVTAMPNERPLPEETQKAIQEIFGYIEPMPTRDTFTSVDQGHLYDNYVKDTEDIDDDLSIEDY